MINLSNRSGLAAITFGIVLLLTGVIYLVKEKSITLETARNNVLAFQKNKLNDCLGAINLASQSGHYKQYCFDLSEEQKNNLKKLGFKFIIDTSTPKNITIVSWAND